MNIKFIAMYLPQYHQIPENDEFWGKGFTDWVSVRKSKPLYDGHDQPRVPQNDYYYDLSKKEDIEWQVKLARENGIYGFGIYHYWFNNEKNLLTRPAEIIRDNKDIDINYFFAWDNNNWARSWSNVKGNAWATTEENQQEHKGPQVLIPYILGKEPDWENHYNEVVKYFKDERYIKKDGKPLFIIFRHTDDIDDMCAYWDTLAKRDGFPGMFFIFKNGNREQNKFHYQPIYSGWEYLPLVKRIVRRIKGYLGIKTNGIRFYSYDEIWRKIIKTAKQCRDEKQYYGAFVSYDDTPRRGNKGIVVKDSTPEKFRQYLTELASVSKQQGKEFIFTTAWNEWGEGAYMEPDVTNGEDYLKAIKSVEEDINH